MLVNKVDSQERWQAIDRSSFEIPILFYFEKEGNSSRGNLDVCSQEEYKLFTYLYEVKYYIDISQDKWLKLRSTESKNVIKGNLKYLSK